MVYQGGTGFLGKMRPGTVDTGLLPGFVGRVDCGKVYAPFVRHLEKQQIRELLDIVAVIYAVVPEGMTESPELVYNVGHGSGYSFTIV